MNQLIIIAIYIGFFNHVSSRPFVEIFPVSLSVSGAASLTTNSGCGCSSSNNLCITATSVMANQPVITATFGTLDPVLQTKSAVVQISANTKATGTSSGANMSNPINWQYNLAGTGYNPMYSITGNLYNSACVAPMPMARLNTTSVSVPIAATTASWTIAIRFNSAVVIDSSVACLGRACALGTSGNATGISVIFDIAADMNSGYCPTLTVTNGGVSSYSSNQALDSYAYLTCNLGYGGASAYSQCQYSSNDVGTWSSYTGCSLLDPYCPALSSSASTTINVVGRKLGDTASYSCALGYILSGSSSVTCGTGDSTTGTWSSTPVCNLIDPYCPASLTNSSSVVVSVPARKLGDIATFACALGYQSTGGTTTATCNAGSPTTGSWNGGSVTCGKITNYCSLPVVTNGLVNTTSSSQLGDTGTLNCDLGYQLSGQATSTCTAFNATHGSWSLVGTCTLRVPYCPSLVAPTNGPAVIFSDVSRPIGATVTYACNNGYQLAGTAVQTCLGFNSSDGRWSDVPATCNAITNYCSLGFPVVTNGLVNATTNPQIGNTATLYCALGYQVNGQTTSTCTTFNSTHGSWSAVGTCTVRVPYCPSLSTPTNGQTPILSDVNRPIGSTVTYACNNGYQLTASAVQTCLSFNSTDGRWSDVPPTCSIITNYCSTGYPAVANGLVNATTNPQIGNTATLYCALGYTAGGATVSTCVAYNSTYGTWSAVGTCTIRSSYCPSLTAPTNGPALVFSDGSRPIGATVTYACNNGYQLTGTAVQTCLGFNSTDGRWSDVPATCNAISNYCSGALPVVTNGLVNTTFSNPQIGNTATLNCALGYQLNGQATSTCTAFNSTYGSWSAVGTCIIRSSYCPSLSTPTNGQTPILSDVNRPIGSTVTYACNNGYQLTGTAVQTCLSFNSTSGVWSGTTPTCPVIANYCSTGYPSVANSTVNSTSTSLGAVATLYCHLGFTSSGATTTTCIAFNSTNGVWGSIGSCSAVLQYCGPVTTPQNGVAPVYSNTSYPAGSTVFYDCNIGFNLTESPPLQTCIPYNSTNGRWSGSTPICVALDNYCSGGISNIPNGYINTTTSFAGSLANLICNTAYYIVGSPVSNCTVGNSSYGIWSSVGYCSPLLNYCLQVQTPTNGITPLYSNTSYIHSSTVTYGCVNGYEPTGEPATQTCIVFNTTNGRWSGNQPNCTLMNNYCPTTTNIARASYTYSTFQRLGDTGSVGCGLGFTTNNLNVTCTAYNTSIGQWLPIPDCSPIGNYCPALSNPNNGGSFVYSNNSRYIGTTVYYYCPNGYDVTGQPLNQSCAAGTLTTGSWSGSIPSCTLRTNYCPVINVANATWTTSTGVLGQIVNFTCNAGYYLVGSASATCNVYNSTYGNWITLPSCALITSYCSSFTVSLGSVSYSGQKLGDSANVSCPFGSQPQPVATVTCQPNNATSGSWSNVVTCGLANNYCPQLFVVGGDVAYSGSVQRRLGESATISCNQGYISGNTTTVKTCLSNNSTSGVWDGAAFVCNPISNYCAPIYPPLNGNLTYSSTNYTVGTVAELSCNMGYTASSPSSVCTRRNETSGYWSGNTLSCVAIDNFCTEFPAPPLASLYYQNGTNRRVGDRIKITCPFGSNSNFFNQMYLPCETGNWSYANIVTCTLIPNFCPEMVAPPNAKTPIYSGSRSLNDTVTITCESGYTVSGRGTLLCLAVNETTGFWWPSEPPLSCNLNSQLSSTLSQLSSTSSGAVIGASVGVVLLVCIVGVIIIGFVIVRKRNSNKRRRNTSETGLPMTEQTSNQSETPKPISNHNYENVSKVMVEVNNVGISKEYANVPKIDEETEKKTNEDVDVPKIMEKANNINTKNYDRMPVVAALIEKQQKQNDRKSRDYVNVPKAIEEADKLQKEKEIKQTNNYENVSDVMKQQQKQNEPNIYDNVPSKFNSENPISQQPKPAYDILPSKPEKPEYGILPPKSEKPEYGILPSISEKEEKSRKQMKSRAYVNVSSAELQANKQQQEKITKTQSGKAYENVFEVMKQVEKRETSREYVNVPKELSNSN